MAEFAIMPIADYRKACDAIRAKTGGTEDITSGELEAQILSIETGVQLPVLVSPGAAAHLLAGYQMIDQQGNIVNGSMPDNGEITGTLDGLTITRVEIPEGYTEGGEITFDDTALAARIDAI